MAELHYRFMATANHVELTNPYALEVKARVMVQEAIGLKKEKSSLGDHGNGAALFGHSGGEDDSTALLAEDVEGVVSLPKTGAADGTSSSSSCGIEREGGYRAPSRSSEILKEVDRHMENGVS
jgi:hypothetical protein